MPEISLNDYFARLNSLLSSGASDEVIHHSRHILKYYPKNIAATRYLGRALVMIGHWDEGRDALRRVLSVIPDDYTSHLALSEANERMNRPDEAIWHLERAFEQRPNDKELIDALRGLYRRYRHIDNLKIQLTSAAVARQYLRSGAYNQAIDALRGALARLNDRLDLKLLLAQTLWQQGAQEEAAEIALEVLKILPDCLEANRVMAQLWLETGRPSDAQRYVNHLESIDPYLAVELVQGEAPDDDAFRVDELDYARSAEAEMTGTRPDWLREISVAPSAVSETPPSTGELSDWASAMLTANKPSAPAAAAASAAGKETTTSRFAAMQNNKEAAPNGMGGLTDIFGQPDETSTGELSALFGSENGDEDEDPMAWLRNSSVELVDEDEEPTFGNLFDEDDSPLPDEADPLAWLKESGGSILEEDAQMGDVIGYGVQADDDAPAWLRDSALLDDALDLDDIAESKPADLATQKMPLPSAKNEPEPPAQTGSFVPGPRRGMTAMLQETNFDWSNNQQDDTVSDEEMDEWLHQFGVTEPRKDAAASPDWLNELEQPEMSQLESDEWFKPEDTPPVPELPKAAPDSLTWMSNDEDQDEDSDWLANYASPDEAQPTPDDEFAWQSPTVTPSQPSEPAEAEPASGVPDWLMSFQPEDDEQADEPESDEPMADSDEDEFAWMTDEVLTGAETSAEAAEVDWFAELQSDAEADDEFAEPESVPVSSTSTPEPAWGTSSDDSEDEDDDADEPNWLAELEGQSPTASGDADDDDEAQVDSEFAWMSGSSVDDEDEDEAEDAEQQPDWLTELAPEAAVASADAEDADDFPWMSDEADAEEEDSFETPASSEYAWLSEDESEPEAEADVESEAEAGGMPSWLSDLRPQGEAAASTPDYGWLSEDESAIEDSEADEEPAAASSSPSWLSDLQLSSVAGEAAAADPDYTWLSEDESAAETEAESEAEPATSSAPDWLSDFQEPSMPSSGVKTTMLDADYTWLSEEAAPGENEVEAPVEAEAEAEPAVMSETPDWLSELAPTEAANEPVSEALVDDADFTWLSEEESPAEAEAEAEPAVMSETPEWLSELAPTEAPVEAAVPAETEYAWLDEVEDEAEAEALGEPQAVGEEPPWLSGLDLPETEADEPVAAEAEIAWTSDEAQLPADEPVAAEEIDWANELAPQAASEAHDFAEDAVASDEFAWLDDVEGDADEEPEQAEPEFAAPELEMEAPAVTELEIEPEPEPEPELEPEFAASASLPGDEAVFEADELESVDLPAAENDFALEYEAGYDDDDALEPTPAQNAPDWLNAMVPGLDVDYEPGEEPEPEAPVTASSAPGFDWLVEVVEEETGEVAPPRFVFSRPPKWMRTTNGGSSSVHAPEAVLDMDDDLPDWPSDDADADVPEWLR